MYPSFVASAIFLLLGLSAIADPAKKPTYPPSKTDDTFDTLHGVKVHDPYRWLERGDSLEVKEWTEQQNAFTRSILDPIPQREKIASRLNTLLDTGTLSVVAPKKGGSSTPSGKENRISRCCG